MTEEWKSIEGWSAYEVSNLGRIRRISYLKPTTPKNGAASTGGMRYAHVILSENGLSKVCKVHALVAAAFNGPRPEGFTIDHKDGDRANNSATNLDYVTIQENIERAIKDGRIKRYKNCERTKSKLNQEMVKQIKSKLADPDVNMGQLGREFGVSRETIRLIRDGKMWKDVG